MLFRSHITLVIGLCLAICVLLSGCGQPDELPAPAAAVENATPAIDLAEQELDERTVEAGEVDAATNEAEETQSASESGDAAYEPPFPDRVDLFVAPKRQGRGTSKSPGGFENAVELLGFVNVDEQRAVLSIDGFVAPLAVGSQEAGIEVISIQPPAVVLQRGRQRWQATLEN